MPSRHPRHERLDLLLTARGLAPTRGRAQALVLAGRVHSRGVRLDKPGLRLPVDAELEVHPGAAYVSRGGHKLAWALQASSLAVAGRRVLDVGASTGGFTQALLQAGAERVIALDVGRGQLDWGLRNDPRVVPLEGVNARYVEPGQLPFAPHVAVMDVSFISALVVLPAVMGCLPDDGEVLCLVKPQFEVGRGKVGRGGVVRDAGLHRAVLVAVAESVRRSGWCLLDVLRCPLPGAEGNVEFFVHLARRGNGLDPAAAASRIDDAASPPRRDGAE
jgi:23S rRNA (cytidine1920-2'-O)/16S rRNA (cytidine1409-2'-O)-methyltransferase